MLPKDVFNEYEKGEMCIIDRPTATCSFGISLYAQLYSIIAAG